MIDDLLLGIGFVAAVEGIALALAPGRLREALEAIAGMDPERRRLLGLLVASGGGVLIWFARR